MAASASSSCSGCDYDYFGVIAKFHGEYNGTSDICEEFFRTHGVLPSSVKCPKCGKNCTYQDERRTWRCNGVVKIAKTKRYKRCDFSHSHRKGTFLENTNVAPWKVILFANHFLSKQWDHSTIMDSLGFSSKTSVDWRSFCSEVTESAVGEFETIGGEGVIVEIDESHFGRRMYEQGRPNSDIWVFGGIERESKKCFFVALLDESEAGSTRREAATLVPLIKKYVRPGSRIISDMWHAYLPLKDEGYDHKRVNHKESWHNCNDPNIHTQNIERVWKDLNEWIDRPGMQALYFKQYFSRYIFLRNCDKKKVLHEFFLAAANLYPPSVPVGDD